LGNGTVTITAGGTTVSTPPLDSNPVTGGLLNVANNALNPIVTAGNALLPTVALSAPLPVQGKVASATVGGSSAPLGVGLLAPSTASGSIAGINLLSGGKTAAVSVLPQGVAPALDSATASVQTLTAPVTSVMQPVLASTGLSAPVSSAVSTVTSAVQPALASVTANTGLSAPVSSAVNGVTSVVAGATGSTSASTPLTPVVSTVTAAVQPAVSTVTSAVGTVANTAGTLTGSTSALAPVTSAVSGTLDASSSLANATAGTTAVIAGSNPLVGASIASPTQSQGSLLSVGLQSGGQPVTVAVGSKSLLGGSGLLNTGTSLLGGLGH
jgi:hypothetical protein